MVEYEQAESLDLRKYLAVLRARKWTILIVVVLVAGAALFRSFQQTPLYRAETRLLVEPIPAANFYPNALTESEVVASEDVAVLVIDDLDLELPVRALLGGLTATPISDNTGVIVISYTSQDRVLTALVANSFARNYIDYQLDNALLGLVGEREDIRKDVSRLEGELRALITRIEGARDRGDASRVISLENERTTLTLRIGSLQQRLDAIPPVPSEGSGGGRILSAATEPASPFSPDHFGDGLIGIILGLGLGIGLAFLRERLDDRFKGRPDVERALESPVLATVPKYANAKRMERELIVRSEPKGAASEAYRNLRTSLQFISAQRGIKSVLVTSPSEHEGKTSTTANLGMALAQAGRTVVLVSADLRRPQLERYFKVSSKTGLSSWLLGEEIELGNIILEDPALPNIRLLPSGPIPSNPAELLTSPRLIELIAELEEHADVVLFDSPPALPVADSIIIASHVHTAVLILDAASTKRSAAVHAKEQLERVGAEVVGCVLNAFDPTGSPYYYEPYYYSQYYSKVAEEGAQDPRESLTLTSSAPSKTSTPD
jgi:capsular exopolysaccharide synthesis family protein